MLSGNVSSAFLQVLIDYLEEFAPQLLQQPNGDLRHSPYKTQLLMPVNYWQQVLSFSAEQLNLPTLGLVLGQRFKISQLGPLGYVLQSCTRLDEAILRLQKYERLINDINHMQLESDAKSETVALVWGAEHGRPGTLVDECAISTLIKVTRDIIGMPASPLSVEFINPTPVDTSPYETFFGCPVLFNQARSRVIFPKQWLDLPLRQSDAVLQQLLADQVDQLMAQLPKESQLIEVVRRHIANAGASAEGHVSQLAKQLAMTERTLHRRLDALGTSYRQIREDTLGHLAEEYLRDHRLTLTEITQMLGFSEQSAFSRAFKSWRGISPLAWRQQASTR
ncbi:MAG: AraC family transcriptional regulator ligand-binding domain-containing protein [Moraxellaceae bacterium]|nr:AraC family transcriptional regulator ligand-binding domain-containing protein [Moraxellaceae bacterium]MDP1775539.1 AraC family transcriptional regulator ligand-binding domain-containing protein [Moraxellaceae bacterium]